MMEILIIGIVIAAVIIGYQKIMKQGTDKFYQIMEDTNQLHKTNFPTRREDVHLVLGNNALWGIIAFDPDNRKICYVTKTGSSVEVLDFSYVRTWKLNWVERNDLRTGGLRFTDVHFQIGTNDIKRPMIKIPISSKAEGEKWMSRLDILFNPQ